MCVDRAVMDDLGKLFTLIRPARNCCRERGGSGSVPCFAPEGESGPYVWKHRATCRRQGARRSSQGIAIVRAKYPTVALRILGNGPLLGRLRELAEELSISDSVVFGGFSLDTPSFLNDLDIYVISSLSEGLPLTLLEAMAAGLPVVSTRVGGVSAIVEQAQCGWIC